MKRVVIAAGISILAWIVLFFGIYQVALNFAIPEKLARLDERGHRTVGRVTGREASDHARVDYEFFVDSIRYAGSGRAGRGNAQFEDLTPGTSIIVTFDPAEPSTSMPGIPEYEIGSIKWLVQAAALVFPIFPIVMLFGLFMALTSVRRSSATHPYDVPRTNTD